jgi:dienelactone hydrolase
VRGAFYRASFLRLALIATLWAALWSASAATGDKVVVPWRAGNADAFQTGAAEERWAKAAQGSLPVTIYRPAGPGPHPYVVLLHGCGGLRSEAMWTLWVRPWVGLLHEHGIGAAVVDSFAPRGVEHVCNNVAAWAVRRADDAHSARAWLAEQPYVDVKRIAVMGMSNGGRTVLAALRTTAKHTDRFVAGIALYPGCQSDVNSRFDAPLLVLIGNADTATPARFCEQMKAAQPASALKLVVYPNAQHAFDMRLPDRTVLGMKLGYDAEADADTRRQVVEFLTTHGLAARNSAPDGR